MTHFHLPAKQLTNSRRPIKTNWSWAKNLKKCMAPYFRHKQVRYIKHVFPFTNSAIVSRLQQYGRLEACHYNNNLANSAWTKSRHNSNTSINRLTWRWHIKLCTMLRQASAEVGVALACICDENDGLSIAPNKLHDPCAMFATPPTQSKYLAQLQTTTFTSKFSQSSWHK